MVRTAGTIFARSSTKSNLPRLDDLVDTGVAELGDHGPPTFDSDRRQIGVEDVAVFELLGGIHFDEPTPDSSPSRGRDGDAVVTPPGACGIVVIRQQIRDAWPSLR